MKKKFIRAFPLLLALLLLLSACSSVPTMRYRPSDDAFVNEKTGTVLYPAPACYQAKAVLTDRPAANLKQKKNDTVRLYEIGGADPAKFLADGDFAVYYTPGTRLPSLGEMDLTGLFVCMNTALSPVVAEVTDPDALSALAGTVAKGAHFSEKKDDSNLPFTGYQTYLLKFAAADLPGLYYVLTYRLCEEDICVYQAIESETDYENRYPGVPVTVEHDGGELLAVYHFGTGILYDRENDRCYSAGSILSAYLE